MHQQPSLRSHVNLLHHNSELSITANSDPMQQAAAATDYFRPYLHTSPYPPSAAAAAAAAAAASGGVAATHHMNPMAPHPASMHHSHYAAPFNVHHPGSRIGDPAAAMAAAAAVSAAAASLAANNNSPTYKGYQDLYANNNPSLELSSAAGTHHMDTSSSSPIMSDQQYNNNNQQRMVPARPQPTRPVMMGGSPKPPKDSSNTSMQPPPLSPLHNNNNTADSLTPPPLVVAHHRSQPQSSQAKSSGNVTSNLASSAALYRDKLGLNSPGNSTTSPSASIPPASPAADSSAVRRLSGNSGASSSNPKFRYPSGPSSNSSPPPPATPSSALSSREGTPLPPSQRPEDAAPNVDISRVQIAESNDSVIKREPNDPKMLAAGGISSRDDQMMGIKREQHSHQSDNSSTTGGSSNQQQQMGMQQQQQQQAQPQQHHSHHPSVSAASSSVSAQQHQFGYSASSVSATSPSTFSAQYPYLAQHQQQHMGWQPQHYYSSPLDGTNNNLMAVRSLQDGLRSSNSAMGNMAGYGTSSYADHQQYGQYGTTIHHYGDPTAQHMTTGSVVSRTPAVGTASAAGIGRGRGHHHSGTGNGVKIGRRPAHLPKVLKFQDKSLPPGWVRKLKCRKHGKQAGRWDVYIYSPCGVKFASKKKLKAFFEKNNLTYDIEEFDFTPYGRHTDSGSSRPSTGSGSGSTANSTSASAAASSSGAGRHNSSGSTGSEGTHTGGSPASLHNYSPTHHHTPLHSSIASAVSTPTSSSTYMPQSMMTPAVAAAGASAACLYGSMAAAAVASSSASSAADFSSFSAFDPLMENPPNASVQDVPISSSSVTDFTASSLVASSSLGGFGVKTESTQDFFPAEMAEILGSSPSVTSSLSNGLTGSAFGPPHGLSSAAAAAAAASSSDPYSDLSRSLHHHAGSLHPLSNASLESRGSTEEEADDALNSQRGDNRVSGLSKAFRALNDFGSVYSFE